MGVSGTGGGFKKFCREETDITNASRPVKASEVKTCADNDVEFIELPIAIDGLSVMVNPKNDWVDHLTVEELKRIWEPQSDVKRWSDVRPEWPDKRISLVGPVPLLPNQPETQSEGPAHRGGLRDHLCT